MTITASGATATSPSITTFGSPILVAWGASDSGGGIATLTIDGTAVDTLTSSGFNGQTIATQNGTTRSLFLKAYPVSAGAHTVRVTTTNASTFEIAWASAIPLPFTAAHTPVSPPRVYVSGVLKQKNDAISAITAAYDGIVRSVVTTFAAMASMSSMCQAATLWMPLQRCLTLCTRTTPAINTCGMPSRHPYNRLYRHLLRSRKSCRCGVAPFRRPRYPAASMRVLRMRRSSAPSHP
jgi:hypothetical protein